MSNQKVLTLDDLYNYYSSTSKRSRHFSAKDENTNIVVQVDGTMKFEADESNYAEGLTPVTLQACHIDENLNHTNISKENMENALPSFANRPILAYIHEVDGQEEFYGHNMHEENGKIVYDEIPVGIIKESCNAHLEEDEEKGHTYVVVDGYLFDNYTSAPDILKREQECSVSVELTIREMSFDAKKKIMNLEDFFFSGVTILGKKPNGEDVKPGMEKSNIKLSDFQQPSVFSNETIVSMLQKMSDKIDSFAALNINLGKEENQKDMNKLEELLEQYSKTIEDVTFDTTDLSDEELEAKFAEVFGEEAESSDPEETQQNAEEETVVEESEEETEAESEEKFAKTFELSHEDVRSALYALLGQYEEADNDWYMITKVFDNRFIFQSWFNENNIYSQNYTIDGDNVQFDGDRVHMNVEYLTDAEYDILKKMRESYEAHEDAVEKLAKYEAEPEKIELLNSDSFAIIRDTAEYAELSKREVYFDMDKEEIEKSLNQIILNYAHQNKIEFSAKTEEAEQTPVMTMPIPFANKKEDRYGGLLSKYRNK